MFKPGDKVKLYQDNVVLSTDLKNVYIIPGVEYEVVLHFPMLNEAPVLYYEYEKDWIIIKLPIGLGLKVDSSYFIRST